jgi:hypothetical protein
MPATYNSGIRYNTGVGYGLPEAQLKKHMAKVKLELKDLTPEETLALGNAHKVAMASAEGVLLYPSPNPAPAVLDPALAALGAKLAEITAAENSLSAMRLARDEMVRNVGGMLTARSKDVEVKSGGNAEKILKAGFQVQAAGSPTTSMPIPQALRAEIGVKTELPRGGQGEDVRVGMRPARGGTGAGGLDFPKNGFPQHHGCHRIDHWKDVCLPGESIGAK